MKFWLSIAIPLIVHTPTLRNVLFSSTVNALLSLLMKRPPPVSRIDPEVVGYAGSATPLIKTLLFVSIAIPHT